MDRSQLTAKLAEWGEEFREISGGAASLFASNLWDFLAGRLIESGTAGEEDPDTVRIRIKGKWRLARVTGQHPSGAISYAYSDAHGSGMGICRTSEIHSEDNAKAAGILDRLQG